jgi:MFS-type transporter involved in bile tolerance (Atg22 family)
MDKTPPSPGSLSARITGILLAGGCLTVVLILGAVFLGVWLDRALGTKPAFTLLMLFGSMPFSLYLIYQLGMRSVKGAAVTPPSQKVDHDGTNG